MQKFWKRKLVTPSKVLYATSKRWVTDVTSHSRRKIPAFGTHSCGSFSPWLEFSCAGWSYSSACAGIVVPENEPKTQAARNTTVDIRKWRMLTKPVLTMMQRRLKRIWYSRRLKENTPESKNQRWWDRVKMWPSYQVLLFAACKYQSEIVLGI